MGRLSVMVNTDIIRLEIPCSVQYINIARKAIEAIASSTRLNETQVEDLKLAVGEACTNAVKYSCEGSSAIQVIYFIKNDCLEVEVRNKGAAFDRSKVARPAVDKLPVGGMGLFLIDQVMDKLDINSESGETTLRMTKKLQG